HARPQHPAARARRADQDRAGRLRPARQGTASHQGGRAAVPRRAQGLGCGAGALRERLRNETRGGAARPAARRGGKRIQPVRVKSRPFENEILGQPPLYLALTSPAPLTSAAVICSSTRAVPIIESSIAVTRAPSAIVVQP